MDTKLQEENKVRVCYPCRGRGRFLEKLDKEDPGEWFTCSCCNGTGVEEEENSEEVKS